MHYLKLYHAQRCIDYKSPNFREIVQSDLFYLFIYFEGLIETTKIFILENRENVW